jgi:hypothetical protein
MTLQGGTEAGTVRADPAVVFVNFLLDGTGNYHLTSSSPAVDEGTLACAATISSCVPDLDFDGRPRPVGQAVDIGPYESW